MRSPRRPTALGVITSLLERLASLGRSRPDRGRAFDDATNIEMGLAIAAGSMFALGLGGWLWWLRSGLGDPGTVFLKSVVFGGLVSFALWLAWLVVVFAVVQVLAGRTIQMERLAAEAGFATAPLALGLLMALPLFSFGIGVAAIGLWVASMQVAVERAGGVRGRTALVANALGFLLWAGMLSLLATGSQPLAPGPFLAESVWEAVVEHAPAIVD